ncbi:MAG: hypothetical protein Kow0090_21090 [Myxococcota bacterium]
MARPNNPYGIQEWVELYVEGTGTLDLNGWLLTDHRTNATDCSNGGFCILGTSSYIVNAGDYIIVYNHSGTSYTDERFGATVHVFFIGNGAAQLANTADRLSLRDTTAGTCVDAVRWGGAGAPNGCAAVLDSIAGGAQAGRSFYDDGADNWSLSPAGNPHTFGADNNIDPAFVAIDNPEFIYSEKGVEFAFTEVFSSSNLGYRIYKTKSRTTAKCYKCRRQLNTLTAQFLRNFSPTRRSFDISYPTSSIFAYLSRQNEKIPTANKVKIRLGDIATDEGIILEAIDANGHISRYGPFFEDSLEPIKEVTAWNPGRFAEISLASTTTFKPITMNNSTNWVKLYLGVAETGIYRLSAENISDSGYSIVGERVGKITLTRNGVEIPYYTNAKNSFKTGDFIAFVGEKNNGWFTDEAAYILSKKDRNRRAKLSSPPETEAQQLERRKRPVRFEENLVFNGRVAEGYDPWIWLFASAAAGETSSKKVVFDTSDVNSKSGKGEFSFVLWGAGDGKNSFSLYLNGNLIFEGAVQGLERYSRSGSFSLSLLNKGENELEIRASSESAFGGVGFDYFEVKYPRDLSPLDTYRLVRKAREATPKEKVIANLGAEALIVAASALKPYAQALADYHSDNGVPSTVFTIEEIYDAFSHSEPTSDAMLAIAKEAYRLGARYLTLFGDDTLDYKDILKFGKFEFVPNPVYVDSLLGRISSLNRLADVNGDGVPELAVGRITARTPQDAENWLNKLYAFGGDSQFNFAEPLIVPDDDEAIFGFASRELKEALPTAAIAEGSDVEIRQTLLAGINGSELVAFFGHGGPFGWGQEGFLTIADIPSLTTPSALVISLSCFTSMYFVPYGQTLGEQLTLAKNGGALAFIGPLSLSYTSLQATFARTLAENLKQYPRIGDALKKTIEQLLSETETERDFVENWVLLGDPLMKSPFYNQ